MESKDEYSLSEKRVDETETRFKMPDYLSDDLSDDAFYLNLSVAVLETESVRLMLNLLKA